MSDLADAVAYSLGVENVKFSIFVDWRYVFIKNYKLLTKEKCMKKIEKGYRIESVNRSAEPLNNEDVFVALTVDKDGVRFRFDIGESLAQLAANFRDSYFVVFADGDRHVVSSEEFHAQMKAQESNPDIENNFTYHAPKPDQPEKYTKLREKAKDLAYLIDELCPNGREKSVAMTQLETAIFWANAAIARS